MYNYKQLLAFVTVVDEGGFTRIAASTIPGEYLLPSLIKTFKQVHSDIYSKVYISDSSQIIQILKSKVLLKTA